ncbi:hypothetical protein ELE36_13445 [Pseudolysobacter antarcticus]|uniref:DUF4878 domain-containing protein n=1 Tax=Pseudolysobacter antarcticus TaxID=2511995 RepID=A0A411HLB4_9GAMM|nr:hypothetical protein [Pseudolysobacter antarcticus]QBB71278.1 hypothetical protein ELE36_13445 [Pseudolysobacter antarcticus]
MVGRVVAGVIACVLLGLLPACHIRGGEPSSRDLRSALNTQIDRENGAGGLVLDTGNAGSFTRLKFTVVLHDVTKRSCATAGSDRMWRCEVTLSITTPPLDEAAKDVDQSVLLFDGPDGWKVVQ